MSERVVVLGASTDRGRYSNRAQRLLTEYGHRVIPVTPKADVVEGVPVHASLATVDAPVDTVTVYLREALLLPLVDDIVRLAPGRVILNPGADGPGAVGALRDRGLAVQLDCTLILLDSGRYDEPPVA